MRRVRGGRATMARMPLQPFDPARRRAGRELGRRRRGGAGLVRRRGRRACRPTSSPGWSQADDVEAYLFADADGGPPDAYGELWLDDEEGEVELARLLVAPERRGRGVGPGARRAPSSSARGRPIPELPDVILRVRPENEQAIRAYAAAGFVAVPADEQATWNEGQRFAYHWMVLPG